MTGTNQQKSYTLSYRLSTDDLISEYVYKIKSAYSFFEKEISDAHEFLNRNILYCKEMDDVLGVRLGQPEILQTEHKPQSAPCPMHRCNSNSATRMMRHLKSKHKLSDSRLCFAMKSAKLMKKLMWK